MKTAIAAIGAVLCIAAAQAAPRAESALECGIAADMAVVAHSLAKEEVQRPKATQIMARIYDVSESDRGKQLMTEILDAAYGASGPSGHQFAEDLFDTCIQTGGNMDGVLGRAL